MMLYKNPKVKVRSPDRDTDYFDVITDVRQGDTLAPYLFNICLVYVLKKSTDKMKDNGFKLTKERSRRYPAQKITDADYANDIAIFVNTPAQTKSLFHSVERAVAGKGYHFNANKTEYSCLMKDATFPHLIGTSLKLMDKFTYQGSSFSSTKKYINTRLAKACTAINRLSVLWKSDLTDKKKRSFFPSRGLVDIDVWMHYMDTT